MSTALRCCALLLCVAARPALAQRWEDNSRQEVAFGWITGVVFGAVAASAAHNAPGGLRAFAVGGSISLGTGLGVSLGHHTAYGERSQSLVWPIVGAGVVAMPLIMTSKCNRRGDTACGWDVLLVPMVSTLGALIAHQLSQH